MLRRRGPDRRAARVVQQRVGAAAHRAARDDDTRFLVARDGRPRRSATSATCADRAAATSRVVLNVGAAHLGEFGSREAIAQAKGELRRGAAGRAAWRCSTPTTRWSRAMAARTAAGWSCSARPPTPTCGPSDVRLDDAGRGRLQPLTPAGARARGRAAARRGAPRRATRSPRPPSRSRLGLPADADRRSCSPRRGRAAGGGWRSPSAPTASPSSTTPTTRTPSRCAPRCEALAAHGAARAAGTWAVLGEMRELGADARRRARRGRPAGRRARRRPARRRSATAPAPIDDRRGQEGSWGERRCCVPDTAAALDAAARRAAPGRRRAGEGVPLGRPRRVARRCSATAPGAGRRVKTVLVAAAIAPARLAASARRCYIRFLVSARLRPVHPRRRPDAHHTKRGTPTMGGAVIIGGDAARLLRRARRRRCAAPTRPALLVLFLMTGLGLVGFLDDYIKISQAAQPRPAGRRQVRRPGARGHRVRAARAAVPERHGRTPASTQLSFIRDTGSTSRSRGRRRAGAVRRLGLRHDRRLRPTA